jgi:zinc transport system ATP-binding protein
MTPLISAQNLNFILRGKTILDNVSLAVQQQDFITIVGPNGAGKSVLLKCLMGLFKPTSGKIHRDPALCVGYVPQRLVPDPMLPMTVRHFLKLRKKHTPTMLDETIAETGIEGLLDTQLHGLSGGELQRVLLARALLNTPDLLVLDEPAQNLDIVGQIAFYKLLENIYKKRPLAILMVSHDLHMVMAATKKVICLFHHICCSGEPQTVTRDPAFSALFGEDMAKMLAVYHHEHNHSHDTADGEHTCNHNP